MGVLLILEFFVSSEVVSSLSVMAVVTVAAVAIAHRDQIRRAVPRVAHLAAWWIGVTVVGLAAPAWYELLGGGSFRGPLQPVDVLSIYRADLLSTFVPTSLERFGPTALKVVGSSFAGGNGSENGEYLGVGLLAALVLITWALWRHRAIRAIAMILAATFILTLGPRLNIDGHVTPVRLPFDLIAHLPIFQNEISLRYSLYLQFFSAGLFAIGLHALWKWCQRWASLPSGSARLGRWALAGIGMLAVCVAVILPLVPSIPYSSAATNVPPFFTSSMVWEIPAGSVALAYPYPTFPDDQPMLWQMADDWRFQLMGGYAYRKTSSGAAAITPALLPPSAIQDILYDSLTGTGRIGLPAGVSLTSAARELVSYCHTYHIQSIFVAPVGRYPQTVVHMVTLALGRTPITSDGVKLWLRVPRDLRSQQ
jgi:hypothetical protein